MKKLFPFFNHYPLCSYFDSAATSLKPRSVIEETAIGYERYTVPAEKSFYTPAEICFSEVVEKTEYMLYEAFESKRDFNIFFNQSVTISFFFIVNRILSLLPKKNISLLVPETVHNVIMSAFLKNNVLDCVINSYNQENFDDLLKNQFDVVYVPSIDHITGFYYNEDSLADYKKKYPRSIIVIDSSQSYIFFPLQIKKECGDIFLMSSHKMYGPDNVAVTFIKKGLFEEFFKSHIEEKHYYKNALYGGSFSYSSLKGFQEAMVFLKKYIYSNDEYRCMQKTYIQRMYEALRKNKNVTVISKENTFTIISFSHNVMHAHDIAHIWNEENIAVRSGDICSHKELFKKGIVRISVGCYNDENDIQKIISLISKL